MQKQRVLLRENEFLSQIASFGGSKEANSQNWRVNCIPWAAQRGDSERSGT
jgi:hypothetical protein